MKTIRALASAIAKREGKKSQAKIGEIRESLSILSDMVYAESQISPPVGIFDIILTNGYRRSKRKNKK